MMDDAELESVRGALEDGPRPASEMLGLLRADGLSDADIAKAKKAAGVASERIGGQWYWRLDFADDLLAVIETEIDCTEAIEAHPLVRRQRRTLERLMSRRLKLAEQVAATGPSPLRNQLEERLARVEAELDALDLELVEDD